MDPLSCNWDAAKFLIFSANVYEPLIYYSHLVPLILSLIIGFFVFFKGRKELINKILFFLTVVFSLWVYFDLILWASEKDQYIMFFWSAMAPLELLMYAAALYLTYLFVYGTDISFLKKILVSLVFLPVIFLTHTRYNLLGYDLTNCDRAAFEGPLWIYIYIVEILLILWIAGVTIRGYKKAEVAHKKQILLFTLGIVILLITFSIGNFLITMELDWKFEQYKLFGMPIFVAFLAYMIVKYKTFEIKLIGAQALVVSMILLVGSQFFFVQNTTAMVLTGVTLALSLGFGYMLIRSVKQEVERKEQLQAMADKLATANDQLRKLDNAKTEFISIASHQLRTPITAIKGFASLLLEGSYGELTESVKGAMEKVYSSSERLVSLIEDLLNVSRIESGRMQFAFEKSNVEKLIKELNDNFILIAKTKKFYLDLKLPETPLPEIIMDYTKIRELVSNFIDNALKYTEKGGVTVKAELKETGVLIDENGFVIPEKKSEFGQMVRITVSDTGIGIPREEIPYLFKKFSRGKDVSRLHVGGTGLGLYVGKAIAEAHHGQVWVESDGADLGSRFIIEIPVEHVA